MSESRDLLRHLKVAQRDLAIGLRLAREIPAHHGVETWAEIPKPNAAEMAELLAVTVAEVRDTLDEVEAQLRRG